jgi:prepilin-type N-terminal cleavage/methylation domain-containing protein
MISWALMDQGLSVVAEPRRSEAGFTIIELMIVVVIIAVLAAVVVPGWFKESRKAKHGTEVTGMFAEIAIKEEQYKVEHHVYLSATTCPSAPSTTGVDFATECLTGSSAWDNLRINPTEKNVSCTYAITAGASGSTPSPPAGFAMVTPASAWWWVVAECDSDGQGGTNATYFQSSVDTKTQKQNEGL